MVATSRTHLILCSGRPVCEFGRIRDMLLQSVSSERAQRDGSRTIHGANSPKRLAAHGFFFDSLGGGEQWALLVGVVVWHWNVVMG